MVHLLPRTTLQTLVLTLLPLLAVAGEGHRERLLQRVAAVDGRAEGGCLRGVPMIRQEAHQEVHPVVLMDQ